MPARAALAAARPRRWPRVPTTGTRRRWRALCRAQAEAPGIGFGKLAQPLRVALTGSTVSPGVFEVMRVLGRDEVLARIEDAATGRNAALPQAELRHGPPAPRV